MILRVLHVFILFFVSISFLQAQWGISYNDPSESFNDVTTFGNTEAACMAGVDLIYTNNRGQNWEILNEEISLLSSGAWYGIAMPKKNHIVVVGVSPIVNKNYALVSTDLGNTWTSTLIRGYGTLHDVDFYDENIGIAVGERGASYRSVDGGRSWIICGTGTWYNFERVKMISPTIAYAISEAGVLIKTIDGGQSWRRIVEDNSAYFEGLAVDETGNVYFNQRDNTGSLYHSKDFGETWDTLINPLNVAPYAIQDNILYGVSTETADKFRGIYRSTSGGQYWENTAEAVSSNINDILFWDNESGIVSNYLGDVYVTNNRGGAGSPSALIDQSAENICPNEPFPFSSLSDRSLTHRWYINDDLVSNNIELDFSTSNDGYYEVELEVSDGTYTDRSNKTYVRVGVGWDIPQFNFFARKKTICEGSFATFVVSESTSGIKYQFFVNGVFQKEKEGRNFKEILHTVQMVDQPLEGKVIAIRTTECGQDSVEMIDSVDIHSHDIDEKVTVELPASIACDGGQVNVLVHNSEVGTIYYLKKVTGSRFSREVEGTGGTIVIPTDNINNSESFNVHIIHNEKCYDFLAGPYTVSTAEFSAQIELPKDRIQRGVPVEFKSVHEVPQYSWNINGAGANGDEIFRSTERNPTMAFEKTSLENKVLLNTTIPGSCTDSDFDYISVYNEAPTRSGEFLNKEALSSIQSILPYDLPVVTDMDFDQYGNIIVAGYHYVWSEWIESFVCKFDREGRLIWNKLINSGRFGAVSALACDSKGNVYLGGKSSRSRWILDNPFNINLPDRFERADHHSYLLKLDKDGALLWLNFHDLFDKSGGSFEYGISDIVINDQDRIYFSYVRNGLITDHFYFDGALQYLSMRGANLNIIEVDTSGKLINSIAAEGDFLNSESSFRPPNGIGYNPSEMIPVYPKLVLNQQDDLVVLGNTNDGISFPQGAAMINDNNISNYDKKYLDFVAFLDADLNQIGESFYTYGYYMGGRSRNRPPFVDGRYDYNPNTPYLKVLNDNSILIAKTFMTSTITNTSDLTRKTVSFPNQADEYHFLNGTLLSKFDRSGNLIWRKYHPRLQITGLEQIDDEVILAGNFSRDFVFDDRVKNDIIGVKSNGLIDLFTASISTDGELNWVDKIGTASNDIAQMTKIEPCSGNLTFFSRFPRNINMGNFMIEANPRFRLSIYSPQPGNTDDWYCENGTEFIAYPELCSNETLELYWYGDDTQPFEISYSADNKETYEVIDTITIYNDTMYQWLPSFDLAEIEYLDLKIRGLTSIFQDSFRVKVNYFDLQILGDSTLCTDDFIELSSTAADQSGFRYMWSDSTDDETIRVDSIGTYSLMVESRSTGCIYKDSVTVEEVSGKIKSRLLNYNSPIQDSEVDVYLLGRISDQDYFTRIDSVRVFNGDYFSFDLYVDGQYTLYGVPDPIRATDYFVPTYTDSEKLIQNATIFDSLGCFSGGIGLADVNTLRRSNKTAEGTVYEGEDLINGTGSPVEGLRIYLSNYLGTYQYETTDRNGYFRFDSLPPGPFELWVDREFVDLELSPEIGFSSFGPSTITDDYYLFRDRLQTDKVRFTVAPKLCYYDTLKVDWFGNDSELYEIAYRTDEQIVDYNILDTIDVTASTQYNWLPDFKLSDVDTLTIRIRNLSSSFTEFYNLEIDYLDIQLPRGLSICTGYEATLTVDSKGGFYGYEWSNGSRNSFSRIDSAGIYWVKVTSGIGCVFTDTIEIVDVPGKMGGQINGNISFRDSMEIYLLWKENENDFFAAIDTTFMNSGKGFAFDIFRDGYYTLYADPTNISEDYLPTYYRSEEFIQHATQFDSIRCGRIFGSLRLVETTPRIGTHVIDGAVFEGENLINGMDSPVEGLRVYLVENNAVQFYTETDEQGKFRFENIADGMYELWADREFVNLDLSSSLEVNDDLSDVMLLLFKNRMVLKEDANSVRSFNEIDGLEVFPNPFNDEIKINYSGKNADDFKFELTDIHGKVIFSEVEQKDNSSFELKSPGLIPGTYILIISSDDKSQRFILTKQ